MFSRLKSWVLFRLEQTMMRGPLSRFAVILFLILFRDIAEYDLKMGEYTSGDLQSAVDTRGGLPSVCVGSGRRACRTVECGSTPGETSP